MRCNWRGWVVWGGGGGGCAACCQQQGVCTLGDTQCLLTQRMLLPFRVACIFEPTNPKTSGITTSCPPARSPPSKTKSKTQPLARGCSVSLALPGERIEFSTTNPSKDSQKQARCMLYNHHRLGVGRQGPTPLRGLFAGLHLLMQVKRAAGHPRACWPAETSCLLLTLIKVSCPGLAEGSRGLFLQQDNTEKQRQTM